MAAAFDSGVNHSSAFVCLSAADLSRESARNAGLSLAATSRMTVPPPPALLLLPLLPAGFRRDPPPEGRSAVKSPLPLDGPPARDIERDQTTTRWEGGGVGKHWAADEVGWYEAECSKGEWNSGCNRGRRTRQRAAAAEHSVSR